jgi:DNA-binding SARP family transcriptional activator
MMLDVNLFGAGRARYSDRLLAGFPNRQFCLLLCYLLLNRQRSHPRERLAAVFWSDYPTPVSLKYLRNCIWQIRKAFQSIGARAEEYLLISDGSVSFQRSSDYWLDVEAFETQVTLSQDLPGQQLTPAQATQLDQAVDLYVGDLLEGIYEDWCLCDRERLKLMYLNALGKLMVFHEAHGAYERGLACGERILAQDDIREKTHRDMMRLYWLLGDRIAALAQYKRCAQILHETLGIKPMEETMRLYQQIVHHQHRPPHSSACHNGPLPWTVSSGKSPESVAEHILQRVHHLQATIDEASAELHQLEPLLREAILQPQGPQPAAPAGHVNAIQAGPKDANSPLERRPQDTA